MSGSEKIVVFGEVLFDDFGPQARVLGGAPFNVAWHLQAFGLSPLFVSRVGRDADGAAIRSAMQDWGMTTDGLQSDKKRSTGRVEVSLIDGQPSYDILADRAYDAIDADQIPDCSGAFVYHGTLALRSPVSRKALDGLAATAGTIIMDVNLRDPYWSAPEVAVLADQAQWVKLNEDELRRVSPTIGKLEDLAGAFLKERELDGLVVTRGEEGACAFTSAGQAIEARPVPATNVVDTVGAGDAFASVLIMGIVRGWPLEKTLERAQQLASLVVSQRGATAANPALYASLIEQWSL